MATANPHVDLECPVCHEDFKVPKFLPCAHVICQRCVLSWLSTQGQGGCPLCRAPILPTTPPGQTDVTSIVDSLPTDLATMALAESQQALNGDHLCGVCDGDVAATSYCLDCGIKLCKTCTKAHGRVPVSRDHLLEDLSTLTAERLAASRRSPCDSHHDKPAELYCRPHQTLICLLCATSKHRECRGVETVADMADHARSELREQARRLRNKEADIDEEIKRQEKEMKDAQAQFSATRAKAKFTCDRLQQTMEKRRQEISAKLQKEEDDFVKPKQEKKALLQEQKTSIAAHAGSVERLVVPSPDSALLGMLNKLKTRLGELETQTQPQVQVIPPARTHGGSGSDNVLRLEQAVADFDHVTGINAPAVYMPYQQMEIEIGRLRALLENKEQELKAAQARAEQLQKDLQGVSIKTRKGKKRMPVAKYAPAPYPSDTSSSGLEHVGTSLDVRCGAHDLPDDDDDNGDGTCPICLEPCRNPTTFPCGHTYCSCLDLWLLEECPKCQRVFGFLTGDQPKNGRMMYRIDHALRLPGYDLGSIVVDYYIPSGVQEACHPNPGRHYSDCTRTAYLPYNAEGKEVLKMLEKAFQQRLIFTIGESATTGAKGVIIWADIHHKTSMTGGPQNFGYPDPDYMKRVKEELAAKGITSP